MISDAATGEARDILSAVWLGEAPQQSLICRESIGCKHTLKQSCKKDTLSYVYTSLCILFAIIRYISYIKSYLAIIVKCALCQLTVSHLGIRLIDVI